MVESEGRYRPRAAAHTPRTNGPLPAYNGRPETSILNIHPPFGAAKPGAV